MPASREEEEKNATTNQDLSFQSIKAAALGSQGQRESSECEPPALFQSQLNLQREIPARLFAKPTIKNEVSLSVIDLAFCLRSNPTLRLS